ncbi:MAG: GNAT family N-acetyltransferase [Aquincola sp.]|nr:GNAT family N-acetyltransferase [Aquincola sp.]MDH4290786.1 GNAT family N-acetyltransferase [Aquincola sp.]MDH5329546.1 GNAT family N-acetyltransferase [Aquincola sp.]
MTSPLEVIETPRLLLRATDVAMAASVAAYLLRNRAAHAPWNPPMDDRMFTAEGQAERLDAAVRHEADGSQIGWWMFLRHDSAAVMGHVRLSQVARGPFCSAMLGYAIDAAHEGRGLMREALVAVLADAFGARVNLHRVQANARPENVRSLGLLDRLGFEREGLAREYLFIDGAWRDHVMTAKRHPRWPAHQAPGQR